MRKTCTPKVIVGLDVGDRYTRFCRLDGRGTVLEEGRLQTSADAFRERFSGARMRVALEVGVHSPWLSRLLEQLGHEVIVANARRVRLIYATGRKNDRLDAHALARLARLDPYLLCGIRHRGEQAQADLALLRSREALVRSRTRWINHVRGLVKSFGGRLPGTSAESFHRRALEAVPAPLRDVVRPMLEMLEELDARIRVYDRRIAELTRKRYPDALRLMQIPGVGPITALCYVLVLHDPRRFRKSRAVGAYLGLTPRQDQSGERDLQLHITLAGDEMLRRLLVQAAHYQLGPFGPDTELRRWGLARAARGGSIDKKRAVIGVARKLAVAMHRMWISGESYRRLQVTAA